MSTKAFFDAVRPILGGKLNQQQVEGLAMILDATADLPISYRAYLLATAHHETGGNMSPKRENLNYSVDGLLKTFGRDRITVEQAKKYGRSGSRPADQQAIANVIYGGAWGRDNLGNTQPNDGWDFRGRGQVQVTGRRNYERTKSATGVDVVSHPDKMLDPKISVTALVRGCVEGWFTRKKLSDYLPVDYYGARRVVNGTDKAESIAKLARRYEAALRLLPKSAPVIDAEPAPAPALPVDLPAQAEPDTETQPGPLARLWAAVVSVFRK